MTKQQYIDELRLRLKGLTQEEIDDAVAYCEEYFDEVGIGNEQKAIDGLGSPFKFAAQIKADAEIKKNDSPLDKNNNSSLKGIIAIIIGICALPIAFPLLIVLLAILFALIISLGVLLFTGVVLIGAILGSGIPLIWNGLFHIEMMNNSLISIGSGLLCIGLAILVGTCVVWLVKKILPIFSKIITSIYHKVKEGTNHEK